MVWNAFIAAKVGDLAFTSALYFLLALVASVVLNFLTRVYDTYTVSQDGREEKSTPRLVFEVVAFVFFVTAAFYAIRKVVPMIPYPFEGYGGYKHEKLSEINIINISTMTLILFQTTLMDKIRILNDRIYKKAT